MNLPERIGRYEIVEELGRGAMGSVFKARDPMVGRIVALKTIHSAALAGAQSEEYRQRFYREARASGVLAHPGIVPVFDVGDHEGAPFLVMEFVDGRTLGDAFRKGERFSLDQVCEIGRQIAEAIGYAHRKGVIHRDVKPANILLTSHEAYGAERPRITDFGIAKLAASEITTTGQLLGTPSFMAPEQFTGSPVDGRADLFSLGVILYSLATGEQPFAGETMTAVSYKIVYTEPIPPSKLNPALSPRLEAVILKCLVKNPAERYRTGEEIAQDLASIRAGAGAAALNAAAPANLADADATLGPAAIAAPSPAAQSSAPAVAASTAGTASTTKKSTKPFAFETVFSVALLAIAGLAAAAAITWFLFDHIFHMASRTKDQAAITQPAPPPQPVVPIPQIDATPATPDQSQPPAAAAPVNATAPASAPATSGNAAAAAPAQTSKPVAPKPKPALQTLPASLTAAPPAVAKTEPVSVPAAAPAASPAPEPAAGASPPHPAAAAFNPRSLDPNASTRLKIDTSRFPSGLPFTIEMNKQTYLRFITGDGTDLENLYVPAGVQEFRVLMKSGGQERDSNTVSDNFKAKKHRTLRVQIMDQGNPVSKVTLPLGKDAQLYLSLN